MELIEGETLSARLARRRMAVEETLQTCAQIAEALEVAHEHGVVHRDVKPGNVIIGPRGLVKVLDFGIAHRATEVDAAYASLPPPSPPPILEASDAAPIATPPVTAPFGRSSSNEDTPTVMIDQGYQGMTVGTPGYMSPEQVLAGSTDARSDVFALGSVLYECLSGRRLFARSSPVETMNATLSAAVDPVSLPEDVPARIRALVARCLEKEPNARPDSMRAVRLELEEALGIRRAAALREGTAYATPNNLPAQATSFVGREGVLRECDGLLERTRLLTLVGIGGSGKSRIAQRIGEAALDRFPDGVWFVKLASLTDGDQVIDVASAALGVQDEPGRTPLEALVDSVGDRRMLFVVDSCEHALEGARALTTGLLAGCSGSRVVATSREPLDVDGETVFSVPVLSVPDAGAVDLRTLMDFESVRLFIERALAAQPDFELTAGNAADVIEICRRLDGIPLALELAAARVHMLGVKQIRERLGDRFKLLAGPAGRGRSGQQTVLDTIQWSWDHLLPLEQGLMRRLAVFTGGWTLERATAVVSDSGDEFEVLDLLTRLVERSLVVVERRPSMAPRYRFLESVWQFALDKLGSHADRALIRERHLDVYAMFAKSAGKAMTGPSLAQQIEELKPEEDNLLAALAGCEHARDGARRGLGLAENISRFWSVLGRYALGRRVLEEAIRRDTGKLPSTARARAQTRAAGFALMLGDHEGARALLEESLTFWRSSDDTSGLPTVLGGLGTVAIYQSRWEDARALGEESLELYRQRGQDRGVAMALHNLGTIESALGYPDHGRARFEQALTILRALGDRSTEALCLSALAAARLRCGDLGPAREALRECFDLLEGLEAPREGVLALEAVAELLCAEDRAREAARFAGAAEEARLALHLVGTTIERSETEALAARVLAAIGPEEAERARAAGRVLSLATALVEARRMTSG